MRASGCVGRVLLKNPTLLLPSNCIDANPWIALAPRGAARIWESGGVITSDRSAHNTHNKPKTRSTTNILTSLSLSSTLRQIPLGKKKFPFRSHHALSHPSHTTLVPIPIPTPIPTLNPLMAYSRDSPNAERCGVETRFPRHHLRTTLKDSTKEGLVIVACGSFSPITYLHLRMFEMAKDYYQEREDYEILAGYFSPVGDAYKKEGLAAARHRVAMCELAVDSTSDWLMVDSWESKLPEYQRTAVVLDHFDRELNGENGEGGVWTKDGERKRIRVVLLAGGDLIASFGHSGIWAPEDLHHILGDFGCVIIERTGTDVWAFLLSHDILYEHRQKVFVVKQLIHNDISSTKIRLFIRRGMSIKYLVPNPVIDYITKHKLYVTK